MRLQERDEKILWNLDKLGCATTSQLRVLHSLGSERNAQRVLHRLGPYTLTKRLRENVFYLNRKGLKLVGSEKKPLSPVQLEHTVMRNDVYIHFNMPSVWLIEYPIKMNGKVVLVPDVTFAYEKEGVRYFVEIDCSQRMINNKQKIETYKKLSKAYKGTFPTIIWLTKSEVRVNKLKELSEGLDTMVLHEKDLR